MNGYHEVTTFTFTEGAMQAMPIMPRGWKPFSGWKNDDGTITVMCRKWVRIDGGTGQ